MKAIFLHGLESKGLSASKAEILDQLGVEVIAPLLDYKSGPIFDQLCDLCENSDFDVLMGSSIGGRMAYHLSNVYKVPALLFNPALSGTVSDELQPIPSYKEDSCEKQLFVFGINDEIVNPLLTLDLLGRGIEHSFFEMGHRVDPQHFERAVLEFKDFLKP